VNRVFAFGVLLILSGCGGPSEDQTSEAAIGNAAMTLEQKADANVNRAVAEIQARSAAEAPGVVDESANSAQQ
jgi:hypothetical protein